jgi:hypothetical protein
MHRGIDEVIESLHTMLHVIDQSSNLQNLQQYM